MDSVNSFIAHIGFVEAGDTVLGKRKELFRSFNIVHFSIANMYKTRNMPCKIQADSVA